MNSNHRNIIPTSFVFAKDLEFISRYIRAIFLANLRCTYTLKMQNYPFLLNPSLYIDNILQRQVCGEDVLVGGLAMEGWTCRLLPTLTVHPGLLQFLPQQTSALKDCSK